MTSPVPMTAQESRLLSALKARTGLPTSFAELSRAIGTRSTERAPALIKVLVSRVRRRLPAGQRIESIRGFGYYFADDAKKGGFAA